MLNQSLYGLGNGAVLSAHEWVLEESRNKWKYSPHINIVRNMDLERWSKVCGYCRVESQRLEKWQDL